MKLAVGAAVCALAVLLGGSTVARSAPACQPTIANGSTPPGETPSPNHHGNGQLWTVLPTNGILDYPGFLQPEGWLDVKFPWWRAVTGALRITGKRLDAAAPPLAAEIPAGYGPTGFQASGVLFPTRGCWEVTGHSDGATLTFVVLATVGRDASPTPSASLLAPRLRHRAATLRWRGTTEAVSFDLRVRPARGSWRTVLRETTDRTYLLRVRKPGRYQAEVRAHDRWQAGPWSRPLGLRLG